MTGREIVLKDCTGIQCPSCTDVLVSLHRHDFKYCSCGECYIDGGREYTRIGFHSAQPDSLVGDFVVDRDTGRVLLFSERIKK
jgi:hypothetical protein